MPPLDHLAALSDDTGLIQHAIESVPNRATGYCTDDVARGFIVATAYTRLLPADRSAPRLASVYLAFLAHAQLDDGRFHNFMDYDRSWLDEIGTKDSCGRAIWALGYGVANAGSEPWRRVCARMLDRALESLEHLDYLRSKAYAMLGLAEAFAATNETRYGDALEAFAAEMLTAFETTAAKTPDWPWFEPFMTYDNGRLPEAMLKAGRALGDRTYSDAGLRTLDFYERVTIEDGIFVPVGNEGWYQRGGRRAFYAQQPLEAAAMVSAQLAAFDCTRKPPYLAGAQTALDWFYGKNSRDAMMANGGGCYDGLQEDGVNVNMGAESTLALLSASAAMAAKRAGSLRAVR